MYVAGNIKTRAIAEGKISVVILHQLPPSPGKIPYVHRMVLFCRGGCWTSATGGWSGIGKGFCKSQLGFYSSVLGIFDLGFCCL